MSKGIRKPNETGTTDVLKRAQRSHGMSRIRGRDTKRKLMVRKDVKGAPKTTADMLMASIRSEPWVNSFAGDLHMFSSSAVLAGDAAC